MTIGEPNWSLLPHRPREFFGLAAEFDRQELRRSYSGLIRRFKPETHPGEFQKIRAAYEQLDAQVRYGHVERNASPALARSIWEAVEQSAGASEAGKSARATPQAPAAPAAKPLAARLESESPAALYQELARSAQKSPRDYYALALIADATLPEDPLIFFKWLLSGLKEHAHDPALFRLVQEHLRLDVSTAELPKVLVAVSKVVSNDRFYLLTESAWERLLRESNFDVLRRTLAACEANLHDYRIASKMAFYARLLRGAMWKADDAWLAEAFAAIDANAGEMDRALEHDWELTSQLRRYRQVSASFVNGHPLRARMDQVIRSFCLEPTLDSARRMAECQNALAHDAYGVMDAFPMSSDEAWSEVVMLWLMITNWVADDFGWMPTPADSDGLRRQTLAALKDMRDEVFAQAGRWNRFEKFSAWSWLGTLIGGPLLLLFGVMPVVGTLLGGRALSLVNAWTSGMTGLVALLWPLTAVVLFRLWLRPRYFDSWYQRHLNRRVLALYVAAWRPRMFRHQHAMAVPASVMVTQLIEVAGELGDDRWLGAMLDPLSGDLGFRIYAAAQPFVR